MRHKELHKTKLVPGLLETETVKNHSILSDYIEIVIPETNVFVFLCKVCGKISDRKSNLINHIESLHFPGCYIHSCKVCMKKFNTRQSLHWHTKANHRETIETRARNKGKK